MDNDKITDECDAVGRLWYRHYTSNIGGDATLYLNEAYRDKVVSSAKLIHEENKLKSQEEVFQSLLDTKILSENSVKKIKEFSDMIDQMKISLLKKLGYKSENMRKHQRMN
jgi:hypothetical protein